MTIFQTARSIQSDLFSNGSGERLAEISRHGGGVPPRFLGEESGVNAKAGGEAFSGASCSGSWSAAADQ